MMDNLVERDLLPSLLEHLKEKEITMLLGARQTGKTTLLLQMKAFLLDQKGVQASQIHFFNLDHFENYERIAQQEDLIQFLQERSSAEGFQYVFIDEAHRLPEAGRYLKGIFDLALPVKMIISGSRSLEINQKTSEALTGRKRVFTLHSFSFLEWMRFMAPELLTVCASKKISSISQAEIVEWLNIYLVFGGYPRIALSQSPEEKIERLSELYSSYLERDVIHYQGIKNAMSFSRLITLMSEQSGNLVNVEELSKILRLDRRTIERYLLLLEETYVVTLLRPFSGNVRTEIVKMPKVYFQDNGFRNYALRDFSRFEAHRDRGKLLENFVFSQLHLKWAGSLYYWRTKDQAEVDFVIRDFYGHLIPVEVKSNLRGEGEISRSMHSFMNAYQPAKAYVVNLTLNKSQQEGSTELHFIYPWQLEQIGHKPAEK